jgi:hypothetical protein
MAKDLATQLREAGMQSLIDQYGGADNIPQAMLPGLSGGSGYGATVGAFDQKVDQYIDKLISDAQGNRDLAIKRIEAEYDAAMGTDDEAAKRFLEKVADGFEQQYGRIQFDYEQATTRVNQDFNTTMSRLAEDEKIIKAQYNKQADQSRQDQNSSLNARGLVYGERDEMGGLGGEEVRKLEDSINERMTALERSIGREREDLTTNKERSLTDITTNARRLAQDSQTNKEYGIADTNRSFDKFKEQQEANRKLQKSYSTSYALR